MREWFRWPQWVLKLGGVQTSAPLPEPLAAVPLGTRVALHGFMFKVVARRHHHGAYPALVLAAVGPTRRRVKTHLVVARHRLRTLRSQH